MKWAKTLILSVTDELEKRLSIILEYMNSLKKDVECTLTDMDATGELGNKMTQRINTEREVHIYLIDLINIAKEDGQIFDLNATLFLDSSYKILIRRGRTIDILGDEEFPFAILGKHEDLDINLFYGIY